MKQGGRTCILLFKVKRLNVLSTFPVFILLHGKDQFYLQRVVFMINQSSNSIKTKFTINARERWDGSIVIMIF